MKLYHGSNVTVNEPKLIPSKRFLDFGAGFYLTSDFEQAKKWAIRTTSNRENGKPTVSVFEFDQDASEKLSVRTFEKPSSEWLRYVAINRTGTPPDDGFDIVIGPVANDQAIRTVNNYLSGYLSEEFAIKLLLPQKLKDQYVFRSEASLSLLKFEEAKLV